MSSVSTLAKHSMSPLPLRHATLTDLPYLTPLYLQSFSDSLSLRCFPRDRESTAAFWTAMNVDEFDDAGAHYLVITDPSLSDSASKPMDSSSGNIVAYAKWNAPGQMGGVAAGGEEVTEPQLPEWPPGGDHILATEFFGHLAQRRTALMGARPHYYLEIVATLPAYRGRGLAGRLIDWGMQHADAADVECYLEGGPGLVEYYARWGFIVEEEFAPQALPSHVESLMRRPARTERETKQNEGNGASTG